MACHNTCVISAQLVIQGLTLPGNYWLSLQTRYTLDASMSQRETGLKRRDFMRFCGLGASAACGTAFATSSLGPFLDTKKSLLRNNNRSTVVCQNGIVCTSQPLASMTGIDILKAGGNCIDAAITANATLGLVEPAMNGIGGDLFAILWVEKDKKLYGLNASGRAPYDWNLEAAGKLGFENIPQGIHSWTVPGCVSGWSLLNERFGKFKLADCLSPAIDYARDGFPVSPLISTHFMWDDSLAPGLAKVFHPNGKVPAYGDIFKNPLLANSYQEIAQGGTRAFYEGKIAEQIVAKSKELGGKMSMRDMADHSSNWVEPVSSNYRGWDVWELPPNGQGIAALQMLNILEQFDIGSLEPNSAEHLHLLTEAKKLAFEDRAFYYADPDFVDVPVEDLISKSYAKKRALMIDPTRANSKIGRGDPELDSDTIYLTSADNEGNMISFIQSNYGPYGSYICPDELGFPIQNRGLSFSLDPNHRNKLESHKRPFHTIIPAFMTRDGRPVMSFGVMGGDFQPQGHAQVVMNMIDFGMSPQQATDQPRLRHVGSSSPTGSKMSDGGKLVFEKTGFPDSVKVQLAQMGHSFSNSIDSHGGYQAIWREENPRVYFGGSDPRKDGLSLSY